MEKTLSSSEIELIYKDIVNKSRKLKEYRYQESNNINESRKKDYCKNIVKESKATMAQATNLLDSFILLVITQSKEKSVKLSGFGTFSVKKHLNVLVETQKH